MMRNPFKLRVACTIAVLTAVLVLQYIPLPVADASIRNGLVQAATSLGFFDIMAGNALSRMSVMVFGISPYISASIIIELLGFICKELQDLQKGTERDRQKHRNIVLTVSLFIVLPEAWALALTFSSRGYFIDNSRLTILAAVLLWTLTSTIATILGSFMSEHHELFVGNGTSLLLVTTMIPAYLEGIKNLYDSYCSGYGDWHKAGIFLIFFLFLMVLVSLIIYIQADSKNIPVYFANKMTAAGRKSFPLKVTLCPSSVIPVVITSSFFSIPALVTELTGKSQSELSRYLSLSDWFNPTDMKYSIGASLYVICIFGFSYYYLTVTHNVNDMANSLRNNSGFIPGIPQGEQTAGYLRKQYHKRLPIGAALLSAITLLPCVISGITGTSTISFMGTSLIIVVSILSETVSEIKGERKEEKYRSKLAGKRRGRKI